MKRHMHLNLFIHSRGHHEASWRHPEIDVLGELKKKLEPLLDESIYLATGVGDHRRVALQQDGRSEVRSGSAQIACLLKPTSVEQVAAISFSGGVMPQKSTDFYPKLLSGLTIFKLQD